VFRRGYEHMKQQGLKDERLMILEAWYAAEKEAGTPTLAEVEAKMPQKIKMRRVVTSETGEDLGMEEYYDYVFPDDEKKVGGLKILEMARKWKAQEEESSSKRPRND
jgi:crooked neck